MFNDMLMREQFNTTVSRISVLLEGQQELKERLIALSKEIKSLKEMVKKIKK